MNRNGIVFTKKDTVEFKNIDAVKMSDSKVLVRTDYTALSGGTEKACLTAMNNTINTFPMMLGYSGSGTVIETGKDIGGFKVGDKVLIYHGVHSNYNCVNEDQLTKIEYDNIDMKQAAFVPIATMSLGGVRKTMIEPGESAMVFGLGILGAFAVEFLRLSGAVPVIAADLNPERRSLALEIGADFAFDPTEDDFVNKVKAVTGEKGVNAIVEVTGASVAMKQALDVSAWMARIALLGCTRVSNCEIDYYKQVHRPGVSLIGAHNFVRPKVDSYPYHWTHHDDCRAILKMLSMGRISFEKIITKVALPETAPEIYADLIGTKGIPTGLVFDWRNV